MNIYLVQHGEALSKEENIKRPLSEKGKDVVEKLANACAAYRVSPKQIYHSTKLRAKQTAEILGHQLGISLSEKVGLEPLDPVRPVYDEINSMESDVMIAGHLPFLERLVSLMLTGSEKNRPVLFQQGGLVCLTKDEENMWSIVWTVFPAQPWI